MWYHGRQVHHGLLWRVVGGRTSFLLINRRFRRLMSSTQYSQRLRNPLFCLEPTGTQAGEDERRANAKEGTCEATLLCRVGYELLCGEIRMPFPPY